MTDIDIIKEIEKNLNIKLEKVNIKYESRGYNINQNGKVTGLGLNGCKIEKVERLISALYELKSLMTLDLSHNQISDISALHKLKSLTTLSLYNNQISDISALQKLISLTTLYLSHNQISDISALRELKCLTSLSLYNNQISDISALKELKCLTALSFYNNIVSDISALTELKSLTKLELSYNQISDISALKELKSLKTLELSNNQINDISALKELKCLRRLYLPYNQIGEITVLQELKSLTILFLYNNKVSDISALKELKCLTTLDLRDNPIEKLDDWITEFDMNIQWKEEWNSGFISFFSNPLKNPPIEIVKQGKAAIRAWFAEIKTKKMEINPFVKLITTGNATVGKTSFIKFLTTLEFDETEPTTHGVTQTTWKPATNLNVSIWDFGGQEYYHSTHQLFFSNHSLYLLMYDKQFNSCGFIDTLIYYHDLNDYQIERLEHFDYYYWLQNIRALSEKSQILMVQNKTDINDELYPGNDCFVEPYNATHPFLSISIKDSYYYKEKNKQIKSDFKKLEDTIITKLNEVKRGEIFEYWLKSKELIESAAKVKPVVSKEEYIEICKPANAEIEKNIIAEDGKDTGVAAWRMMTEYFHDTGVLLFYPNSTTLNEKVFIKPTYITDQIYKVLNYKVKGNQGKFSFNDVLDVFENNEQLALNIVELMSAENFKLIFKNPKGLNNYIAPQYLPNDWTDKALLYHSTKNMKTSFILHFVQFLPKFILTEFMVAYGRFQSEDIIWKYGIIFEKYKTTAFVECFFNEQKIIYKSDNKGDYNRLKYEVFDNLCKINKTKNNLKISINEKQPAYEVETVLKDNLNTTFKLFRIGYVNFKKEELMTKKELDGIHELLDLKIEKKNFLQNELTMAYASNQKFALQKEIKDLEKQINKLKKILETFEQNIQVDNKDKKQTKQSSKPSSVNPEPQPVKAKEKHNFTFAIPKETGKNKIGCHFGVGNMGTGLVIPYLLRVGCKIVLINRPGDNWKEILKPEIKEIIISDSNDNKTTFFIIHDSMADSEKESVINQWISKENAHIFLLTENETILRKIIESCAFITTALKSEPAYQWCSQILNDCKINNETFVYPFENNRDVVKKFKKLLINSDLKLKEIIADRLCSEIKISVSKNRGFIKTECESYGFVVINHSEKKNPFCIKNFSDSEIKFTKTDKEFEFYHKRKFTLFNCVHAILSSYIYHHLMLKEVPVKKWGPHQLNIFDFKYFKDKIKLIAQAEIVYIIFGLDQNAGLRNTVFPGADNFKIYSQLLEYSNSILDRIFSTSDTLHRVLPIKEFSSKYKLRIKELISFYDDKDLQTKSVKSIFKEIKSPDNKIIASQKLIKDTINELKTFLLDLTTND